MDQMRFVAITRWLYRSAQGGRLSILDSRFVERLITVCYAIDREAMKEPDIWLGKASVITVR